MLGIVGIDTYGSHVNCLAAGTGHIFGPMLICQQRASFGHAVTYQIRELDAFEELLHLGIESGAAHDELLHLATECLHEAVLDFLVDDVVDSGNLEKHLHKGLVEGGLDL